MRLECAMLEDDVCVEVGGIRFILRSPMIIGEHVINESTVDKLQWRIDRTFDDIVVGPAE